jgi:hypothetical protein
VERAALGKELAAGGAVDGAIDATTAQEGFIRGVDDGVHLELGDVALNNVDARVHG